MLFLNIRKKYVSVLCAKLIFSASSVKLSILIMIKLMIHWTLQSSYVNMSKLFGITRQTCSDFCQRIRYVISVDYDRENVLLGGNGEIIEIDESLFAKVYKYNFY
jgi:hypothetical protein